MHIRWVKYPIVCTEESTGPSNTAGMAADREDRRSRAAEASRAEQEREIRFMAHPLEEWGYRLMGRAGQAESVWRLTGRAEQAGRVWWYLGRAGQAGRECRYLGRAEQSGRVWRYLGRAEQAGRVWRYLGRAGQADRVWRKGLPAQVQPGWPGVQPWLGLRATFPLGKTHRAA